MSVENIQVCPPPGMPRNSLPNMPGVPPTTTLVDMPGRLPVQFIRAPGPPQQLQQLPQPQQGQPPPQQLQQPPPHHHQLPPPPQQHLLRIPSPMERPESLPFLIRGPVDLQTMPRFLIMPPLSIGSQQVHLQPGSQPPHLAFSHIHGAPVQPTFVQLPLGQQPGSLVLGQRLLLPPPPAGGPQTVHMRQDLPPPGLPPQFQFVDARSPMQVGPRHAQLPMGLSQPPQLNISFNALPPVISSSGMNLPNMQPPLVSLNEQNQLPQQFNVSVIGGAATRSPSLSEDDDGLDDDYIGIHHAIEDVGQPKQSQPNYRVEIQTTDEEPPKPPSSNGSASYYGELTQQQQQSSYLPPLSLPIASLPSDQPAPPPPPAVDVPGPGVDPHAFLQYLLHQSRQTTASTSQTTAIAANQGNDSSSEYSVTSPTADDEPVLPQPAMLEPSMAGFFVPPPPPPAMVDVPQDMEMDSQDSTAALGALVALIPGAAAAAASAAAVPVSMAMDIYSPSQADYGVVNVSNTPPFGPSIDDFNELARHVNEKIQNKVSTVAYC